MITLTQLQYFRVLATYEHVSMAAESLNISQTALTTIIKRLESELGVQLFEHRGRNIYLNEYGKRFRYYADNIFRELDNAETMIKNLQNSQSNVVTFSLVGASTWNSLLTDFQMLYPSITLNHFELSIEQFRTKLMTQEIDFVIEGGPEFDLDRLDFHTLIEVKLYAVVHRNHHLASRTSIELKEIQNEPVIALNKTHSFRLLCDHFCHMAGFEPKTVIECYNSLWKVAFDKFNGVTFVSSFDKYNQVLGDDVVYIPISDDFVRYPINLYWL